MSLLALGLLVSGCVWEPVAYQPQPEAVTDPAREIKALLKAQAYPPTLVEVSDEAVKEFYPCNGCGVSVLPFTGTSFRIITRDEMYMVAAYDGDATEIWAYSPPGRDRATCERMMDALSAAARRPLRAVDLPWR